MVDSDLSLLTLSPLTWYADVRYRGVARLIACAILDTSDGIYLVDPGPSVSLASLSAALEANGTGLQEVRGLLLTHIHLDHAGAAGSIIQANAHVEVYVHARGARHLVAPERLLASARRIYGDRMDSLWGDVVAIPRENIHALQGGECLRFGAHVLRVADTPGHASHHVCYLDEATGTLFAGDVAGMRVIGTPYIVPVAPPPDIDLTAWRASLEFVHSWKPAQLFLTHFGEATDVDWHLNHTWQRLDAWAAAVRNSLDHEGDDATRAALFHEKEMAKVREVLCERDRLPYEHMGQPRESWYGLARYWRKAGFAISRK